MRSSLKLLAAVMLMAGSGQTAAQTKEAQRQDSRERPNIMIILLDDVGFGQLSAFGGPYRVPHLERLAREGLRYTNFHTTALCSPTRAALLTGRNHHSVGMATITETASEQPGYNGIIPKSAGTLAAILKTHGYRTYGLGKWHLTPQPESGIDGPFDRWPTSMGFDHWYGFQGADTDQWTPGLWRDTTPVEPPHDPNYHLTTDLADHAVKFLQENAANPEPFFLYFATGAGHAPHQVAKSWIDRNRGRFQEGWDLARQRTFANQKKLGIIPANAVLPPRNESIKAWDELGAKEKELFTRMQEVHAGFIEHTDHEIGRVLSALEKSGQKDNTLIFFTADNGASGEGGPFGSINEFRIGGAEETFQEVYAVLPKLGGVEAYNHYPAGWAQAGNAPFKYWKQQAHEGGIRDPMIVSWPARIKDQGSIRRQFQHVIDVTPTILEAVGIAAPAQLAGVSQMPIEGSSMVNTFASPDIPTAKSVQYFEMIGNRGIWAEGWKAVAFHGRLPWFQKVLQLPPFEEDRWELYHLDSDPTESRDLAKLYPEKLQKLQKLFGREARNHQVYPLDGSGLVVRAAALQSALTRGVAHMSYDGPTSRVAESRAPWLKARSHTIDAILEVPDSGVQGTIVAHGGRFGGYALYVKDRKLHYAHNYVGQSIYTLSSHRDLPHGLVQVRFQFELLAHDAGIGSGIGRLFINDELVAEEKIPNTVVGPYGFVDTFDVGSDTVTPVDPRAYEAPFPFSGRIEKLSFTMGPAQELFEDEAL